MVVDDDENDTFLIEHALRRLTQFRFVAGLASAEQAIEYFSGVGHFADRHRYPIPDLVSLDLKMPGLGGFACLAWLQKNFPERPFKVVVLTNSGFSEDEKRARELGADEFHQKPFGMDHFVWLFEELGRKLAEERPAAVTHEA